MTSIEFIIELHKVIGGRIMDNVSKKTVGGTVHPQFPEVTSEIDGYYVNVDFHIEHEIEFAVYKKPPHYLTIAPDKFPGKLFRMIGLGADIKIDDPRFDDAYIIQDSPPDMARKTLDHETKDRLYRLHPFVYFRMDYKNYRIKRDVSIDKGYTVSHAVEELQTLVNIVKHIERVHQIKE
jgi:hypothetical protein